MLTVQATECWFEGNYNVFRTWWKLFLYRQTNPSTLELYWIEIANELVYNDQGTLYFETSTDEAISYTGVQNKYGVDANTADLPQLGIAELIEQPTYAVAGYAPDGDKYRPIEDLSPKVAELENTIDTAEARIAEVQEKAEEVKADIKKLAAATKSGEASPIARVAIKLASDLSLFADSF